MTMPSYRLRLKRAESHLKALDRSMSKWTDRYPTRFIAETDPETGDAVLRRGHYVIPRSWPLLVGDCLHNIRSALDHAVYDMAVKASPEGVLDPRIAEGLEFPIFWTGPMTPAQKRQKIGAIPVVAQDFIESVQPHHNGEDFREHPLWVLHELERIDKHRLLHVVSSINWRQILGGNNAHIVDLWIAGGELKPGAEAARYRVEPIRPDEPMEFHLQLSSGIGFADGPMERKGVANTLASIIEYVDDMVIAPLAPYL